MATYNDGDMLVDNKTWNVYQRTNGSWSLMGNIKGEKGDNGAPGNQLLCGAYYSKISPIVLNESFSLSVTAFNRTAEVGELFNLPCVTQTSGKLYYMYWAIAKVTAVNALQVTSEIISISSVTIPSPNERYLKCVTITNNNNSRFYFSYIENTEGNPINIPSLCGRIWQNYNSTKIQATGNVNGEEGLYTVTYVQALSATGNLRVGGHQTDGSITTNEDFSTATMEIKSIKIV